jgi:uncharacterized membrane protein YphA (DoxX/SURF4 family)
MLSLVRLGRFMLAVGMVALGGIGLGSAGFLMEWTQAPARLPAHAAFAYLHSAILIVAGVGLLFDKTVRYAAFVLGTVWLLWAALCVPLVIGFWRGRAGLEAEVFGLTCGLFVLAGLSRVPFDRTLVVGARYAFALCLPVYGLVHFLYPQAVASWLPKWLPAHMFWAYFTGVAHVAAGLAILSGVLARLGARLFALMVTSWVFLLHIPRVAATPHDRHEWITLFIAVVISGAAWIVAGSLTAGPASEA